MSKATKIGPGLLAWVCLLGACAAAGEAPPQAEAVRAVHRAGQTFITWKEVAPLITDEQVSYGQYLKALAEAKDPVRYRIYAAARPIDAASIGKAELVGEVGPLSAYNVNARNKEYLLGQAMIRPDRMGELAENYNGLMHTWTMDSRRMDRYPLRRFVIDEQAGPLPAGTGLYVHHPAKAGESFYAVVAVRGDAANRKDFASNTAGPVAETVGTGEPVRQGKGLWGPSFDYPGTRWTYVQWCAPPLAPRPNMAFNWSVLLPPHVGEPDKPVLPGMQAFERAPAEVYFHASGYSYAQPGMKMMLHSIQIAPHDYPPSGWYGYHEAWGTRRELGAGKVHNHTQRRIIAFLEWAKKRFPIDPDQVIATGFDGAAAAAIRYPEEFACVWIEGFDRSGGVLDAKAAETYQAAWGRKSPEITDETGRGDWAWADLDQAVLTCRKDLPLTVCLGYSWGPVPGYAKGQGRFYKAMQQARQPLMAYWGWNGLRERGRVNQYDGVWRGKRIDRMMAIPAFSSSSRDSDRESEGNAGGRFDWKDITDQQDRFAVTIVSDEGTFDLTPRRLRSFRPVPGEKLAWTAQAAPDPRSREKTVPPPQSGVVEVAADGTFTIPRLSYPLRSPGMAVTITRAAQQAGAGQETAK